MSKLKLKPCPFCGADYGIELRFFEADYGIEKRETGKKGHFGVACSICGCQIDHCFDKESAIYYWNMRANDAASEFELSVPCEGDVSKSTINWGYERHDEIALEKPFLITPSSGSCEGKIIAVTTVERMAQVICLIPETGRTLAAMASIDENTPHEEVLSLARDAKCLARDLLRRLNPKVWGEVASA